ncbi:uncharacterized protein LOC142235362 [Haematobia irritans]|uniref:uncharacterized protein LOC142235362 n=1 Tax=Haematobia irritans TaxID=7368 RepID=UPI003F4FEE53
MPDESFRVGYVDDIVAMTRNDTLTSRFWMHKQALRLDIQLTYFKQIEYAKTKAATITARLSRLMANIGGPLSSRRKQRLPYRSEIWVPTLQRQTRANKLLSAQKTAALIVTSSYRTVSVEVVIVIEGMSSLPGRTTIGWVNGGNGEQ